MFLIKKEQIRAFNKVRMPAFEEKMIDHLSGHFRRQASIAGISGLSKLVRRGYEASKNYGFATSYECCLYIDLMIMLGHGFDTDPQLSRVNEILVTKDVADPTERINLTYKRTLGFMETTIGKKEVFPKAQFEKTINFPFDELGERLNGGFQKGILTFFETFWPEKFREVNKKLPGLIYSGLQEANELGFTTRVNVGYYLTLVFLLGHRFATDPQYPWLMKVLHDPELKEESYKATCLHFMVRKHFEVLLENKEANDLK